MASEAQIKPAGQGGGLPLLLIVSILFLAGGMVSLSDATLGVGSVAVGCAFGILARIVQAGRHHEATIRALQIIHGNQATAAAAVGLPVSIPTRAPGDNEIQCRQCGTISTRGPKICATCGLAY